MIYAKSPIGSAHGSVSSPFVLLPNGGNLSLKNTVLSKGGGIRAGVFELIADGTTKPSVPSPLLKHQGRYKYVRYMYDIALRGRGVVECEVLEGAWGVTLTLSQCKCYTLPAFLQNTLAK
jgi:hypothetical protein